MKNIARRTLHAPGAANLWAILLALGVTTVTCLASGAVKTISGQIAPIWLTNGVLLAQVLVAHGERRHFVLAGGALGNLAANPIVGESLQWRGARDPSDSPMSRGKPNHSRARVR